MNFEKPDNNDLPEEQSESRRSFLRKSLGFTTSIGTTGAITQLLPKWEEEKRLEEKIPDKIPAKIKELLLSKDDFSEILEDSSPESSFEIDTVEEPESLTERQKIAWTEFVKIKPDLQYKEIAPPLRIENLRMPNDISRYGATTHEGKMLRTLRYKNVTDAVETRYNLPPGILLAMIMEESTGVDLLPNARGDGGFGLCHMQGSTAAEYGLKTFHECNSLVCNGKDGRSCKDKDGNLYDHAGELTSFIKENSQNRKKLIEADERLNILLNIDAAGRMLATGMAGPKLKGRLSRLGPLRRSVARYSGAYNYENYWKDICTNMKDLENPDILKKLEEEFNKKNPHLKINGEPADFKKYIEKFQEQHINYGLKEYEDLPKYEPNNSVTVINSYKDYI